MHRAGEDLPIGKDNLQLICLHRFQSESDVWMNRHSLFESQAEMLQKPLHYWYETLFSTMTPSQFQQVQKTTSKAGLMCDEEEEEDEKSWDSGPRETER